jgi:phenylacetic acid degradation operon negative regulatory protein
MMEARNTTPERMAAGERPLGARSLILSLLLRSEPPRIRGARLVQWCELFGVAEGTVRVALSRMFERGELRADAGSYELAGRVALRRGAQDWSLAPRLGRWRGTWRTAIVAGGARPAAERSELRETMRQLRYGELRAGVWTRPDNLPRASAPAETWAIADAQCQWWSGRPDREAADLADALFDGRAWASRAAKLSKRLDASARVLAGAHDAERGLAGAFLAGTVAVAHVRADPLLPAMLGPAADAGDALRAAYREYETEFARALRAWFRERA